MKYISILIIFCSFVIISCKQGQNKTEDIAPKSFREFIQKFRQLQLPIFFHTKLGAAHFNYNSPSQNFPSDEQLKTLPLYNENSNDSLYIKEGKGTIYYGILPDTSNYYGIVLILGGVQGSPIVLKIYSKQGKLINEEVLYCAECSALINLEWCSSNSTIKNDFNIYSVDTMKTVKFDNNMKIIDSTGEYYIIYKDGKIDADGKIKMNKVQRKNLK